MARKLQMKHNLYQSSRSKGYVELISSLGQDGLTSVNAARASFGIEKEELSDKDIKLLKYCMKEKHTSIFEHNVITFRFKVPLFVARQHMRHRTWSFNEISRRYTKVDIDFYEPITFRTQHKSNRQASLIESAIDPILYTIKGEVLDYDCTASEALRIHRKNALQLYNQMINNGIAREQARMVLPQNLYTTYWGTVNLNNLIKFTNRNEIFEYLLIIINKTFFCHFKKNITKSIMKFSLMFIWEINNIANS